MWDERYSDSEYIFGVEPNDFLKDEFERIPAGARVLCLAEGEGRNAVFLAQNGYEVTGIDSSKVGLDKAQQLAKNKGVTITTQVVDLADYEFGEQQWDAIVVMWVHLPTALRQQVHAQIAPALKLGGVLILEAYTQQQLTMDAVGGPPASEKQRFGALSILRDELAELQEIIGIEKTRMVSEGTRHHGLSAVVQFIAQKK